MNLSNQAQRSFINKAKSLARVMAKANNVMVTVSGDGAYCDPGLINLPLGDYSDQVWREMLEGWIDHELGHLSLTDIVVFNQAKAISEFHMHILNIIEDIWMERTQSERFPGSRINLERLSKHAIDRNLFPLCSSVPSVQAKPLVVLDYLILYRGRNVVTGHAVLKSHADDAYMMACQVFGQELADKFCEVIDSITGVSSTKQAFDVMLRIVELLQMESEHSDSDGGGLQDFHEALSEMLSKDAEEAQEQNPGLTAGGGALLGDWKPPVMMEVDSAAAKSMSGRIYPALNKVLFDQVETLPVARNRGNRLIANKLSGVPSGNFSVFRKRVEQQDLSAAVSIIVDASGSMRDDGKMAKANVCTLALAKGLHKAGVATNVTYFGVYDGDYNRTFTAKNFDEPALDKNFGVSASGGTPTAQGMLVAMNQLVLRNEGRKVMFILTDGDPDCEYSVKEMAELARSFDIKVVPIGIETSKVRGFSADEFVCVKNIMDLPAALKEAVKNKLFN